MSIKLVDSNKSPNVFYVGIYESDDGDIYFTAAYVNRIVLDSFKKGNRMGVLKVTKTEHDVLISVEEGGWNDCEENNND